MSLLNWRGTIPERLVRWSTPEGDCVVWVGTIGPNGYGVIHANRSPRLAHRIAYQTHVGDIPEGMVVAHTCDNRRCIRLEHLVLMTQAENLQDMKDKGRSRKGLHHPRRHSLSDVERERIRDMTTFGVPRKQVAELFGIAVRTVTSVNARN